MTRFDGRTVFVTGVARGQGRNHALRFAEQGARVIGLDLAQKVATTHYPGATAEDLEETEALLRKTGAEFRLHRGDVRSRAALDAAVADGLDAFGGIDIVLPTAGITSMGASWELSEEQWDEMIAINLTGVWRTLRVALPSMVERGAGGSIVLTGSIASVLGMPHLAHYTATKHGVQGMVKALANELAPHRIRVNSVNPTNVATPMIHNDATYQHFRPDVPGATQADAIPAFSSYNLLGTPWVECDDVTNAVMWLCSEQARYITGAAVPVDTGTVVKWPGS